MPTCGHIRTQIEGWSLHHTNLTLASAHRGRVCAEIHPGVPAGGCPGPTETPLCQELLRVVRPCWSCSALGHGLGDRGGHLDPRGSSCHGADAKPGLREEGRSGAGRELSN